jgi:hypothetical protein
MIHVHKYWCMLCMIHVQYLDDQYSLLYMYCMNTLEKKLHFFGSDTFEDTVYHMTCHVYSSSNAYIIYEAYLLIMT